MSPLSAAPPRHVAIIMDGNGRWAKKRFLPRLMGHRAGVKRVREVIQAAAERGLGALTLYSFSAENWNRPALEVQGLMALLDRFLSSRENVDLFEVNAIQFRVIGVLDNVPAPIVLKLQEWTARTAQNHGMVLTLALSYSSQQELVLAARALARRVQSGELSADALTTEHLEAELMTEGLPPLDLLIRTSGELRISNFLLWQAAYAEFYFTDTLWPDFGTAEFEAALADFQTRRRRFGKTDEQLSSS